MPLGSNLASWFGGGTRDRELRETRAAWEDTERLWRACPLSAAEFAKAVVGIVFDAADEAERRPAHPVLVALCEATDEILHAEDIVALEAKWDAIDTDLAAAAEFREMMTRRRRWVGDYPRMSGIVRRQLLVAYRTLFAALPESCFGSWDDAEPSLEVPLIELLEDPAEVIQALILFAYDDETLRFDLFLKLRRVLVRNLLVASGFAPDADAEALSDRLIVPTRHKCRNARELADLYLAGTPFAGFLEMPVPFHIPEAMRFEHCHIVGGTGHGKTQLMQRMIHADLIAAQKQRRSVVVIDSQGDLINKLMRLGLFDPDAPDSLADRLVIVDPADVEFPAALNLFDAHLDRLSDYRPVDRERVLNGVIELYEVFFGAMLGAELTQKQGVIFRYLARLMITIPDATIHTLMQLMEDGRPFKPHMDKLDGSARYFFQTEFFHPSFAATKKQILKRLWGVLSTPAFERMFAQTRNKLDLFEAMNDGKIILISTAKDLLKTDGSQLFGRFFIAMLAQAALERSTLDPEDRTPTFVYVDEAQEYFDDSIETILNQARKYRVGITLAHQTLDQLSTRLRSAILANTSLKCAGGVSARDARALADELRTTPDFIESMRRRGERSEFAVWMKQMTHQAIRVSIPLGFLERQPLLTEEAFGAVIEANRRRYCGTLAEVVGFIYPLAEGPSTSIDRTGRAVDEALEPSIDDVHPQGVEVPYARAGECPAIKRSAAPRGPQPRAKAPTPEMGKGGPQHRYIQHLIKGLAEERGFRAVIEEQVDGGQVDIALHRDGLSIACEISVTSTASYELGNLRKCLGGAYARIFLIAANVKRLRAIETLARGQLSAEDVTRIDFLTPDTVMVVLDDLRVPNKEETVVRGYRVKVSRTRVGAVEAQERRAAVARVIAQSLRNVDE